MKYFFDTNLGPTNFLRAIFQLTIKRETHKEQWR